MSDWASKLQRKDSVKEGPKEKPKTAPKETQKENAASPPAPAPAQTDKAKPVTKNEASDFNGTELAAFLKKSYSTALEEAKKDKAGEKSRIYRSLDSHSGWTKANGNKKEDRHVSIVTEVTRQVAAGQKSRR
ncbi:hypothetical protein FT663_03457 [Candidozyma haemuli var. vulneris]|uniref:Uncharacterized protein n=1 Tax=Candidozyma haemuli TaxID=45357 RepID=A0A2V1AVJ5_9ASCO|nr:hypothetical protein CXQ85_000527 [[Candida] haemuloni]KAF3988251.1 hypothetical protein FT662_03522 [[Candida] haemuloni var. vulneris]KAF3989796.1 hypothetical protein FT663_03457 [[Candida] haemuloni var. vulneris]PVH21546.1 hypothetical protein CXQ85_000527 [[Candida] haemuloni]